MSAETASVTTSSGFIICSICERKFKYKQNLRNHVKKFHPFALSNYTSVACSICKIIFQNATILKVHMDSQHGGLRLITENKTFYSMEEFEEWKTTIEEKSRSCFVKHRGDTPLAGKKIGMYFYCHRSGRYHPHVEQEERKRRIKNIGSNKIGKTCPARITAYQKVIDEGIQIEVEYQSTHIGHETEVERIPLSKTVKSKLLKQVNQGIPYSEILSNLQKSCSPAKHLYLINDSSVSPPNVHSNDELTIINEKEICDQKEHLAFDKEPSNLSFMSEVQELKSEMCSKLKNILDKCNSSEELKNVEEKFKIFKAAVIASSKTVSEPPSVMAQKLAKKKIKAQKRMLSHLKLKQKQLNE